ncbi:MAG: cytochrome C oxidase subunit IV family protein [Verrucomicrobiota bacterium]|jgi:cytochrome c oxidase subunit IV|nr:cytochrome C oxidase subunit IV family protein [Verrucomicrobiota bacterium]
MSGHSPEEIKKTVKTYKWVFGGLMIGTILTVAASYWELDSMAMTVGLALLIATLKAGAVALYFMHLIDEKKSIYMVLGFTAFFFMGLMVLTIWASGDKPLNTVFP